MPHLLMRTTTPKKLLNLPRKSLNSHRPSLLLLVFQPSQPAARLRRPTLFDKLPPFPNSTVAERQLVGEAVLQHSKVQVAVQAFPEVAVVFVGGVEECQVLVPESQAPLVLEGAVGRKVRERV